MKIPEGYLPIKVEAEDGAEIRQEIFSRSTPAASTT